LLGSKENMIIILDFLKTKKKFIISIQPLLLRGFDHHGAFFSVFTKMGLLSKKLQIWTSRAKLARLHM